MTVTGAGGSGKTRLAVAAAASLTDVFARREAFVALASLRQPALVAESIAAREPFEPVARELIELHVSQEHPAGSRCVRRQ